MKLLTRTAAADRAGFSVSTLKRLEVEGTFPTRVQITAARVGYVEDEVDTFIADRIAARDAAA